jgi:hypothetical protein
MQKKVETDMPLGVVGERFQAGGYGDTKFLTSSSATIGTVVTQDPSQENGCVVGGTGPFLGIIGLPKSYPMNNDYEVEFTLPTQALKNGQEVNYYSTGTVQVKASTPVDIKVVAKVFYDNTTGILGQGSSVPAGSTEIPARFIHRSGDAGTVVVVDLLEGFCEPASS